MLDLQKWDIWEADVPFSENKVESKRRPVLIISPSEVLVLKMTSHNKSSKPKPYEFEIMKWEKAGLSVQTYIQCDKYIRLKKDQFTGKKYGRLQAVDIIGVQALMHFHGLIK